MMPCTSYELQAQRVPMLTLHPTLGSQLQANRWPSLAAPSAGSTPVPSSMPMTTMNGLPTYGTSNRVPYAYSPNGWSNTAMMPGTQGVVPATGPSASYNASYPATTWPSPAAATAIPSGSMFPVPAYYSSPTNYPYPTTNGSVMGTPNGAVMPSGTFPTYPSVPNASVLPSANSNYPSTLPAPGWGAPATGYSGAPTTTILRHLRRSAPTTVCTPHPVQIPCLVPVGRSFQVPHFKPLRFQLEPFKQVHHRRPQVARHPIRHPSHQTSMTKNRWLSPRSIAREKEHPKKRIALSFLCTASRASPVPRIAWHYPMRMHPRQRARLRWRLREWMVLIPSLPRSICLNHSSAQVCSILEIAPPMRELPKGSHRQRNLSSRAVDQRTEQVQFPPSVHGWSLGPIATSRFEDRREACHWLTDG